jgi:hypothetical protein
MKKIICWLFGHNVKPYLGNFYDPRCVHCGERVSVMQMFKRGGH